ncbi:MAG TPA: hypothetical protein VFQ61_14400 [Polyangiaceae bacterium]|nr:hypothetical protein [Polyangiaceae bacterium]
MATACPAEEGESSCRKDADCPANYLCDSLVELCRPIEALSCHSPADCSDATCSRAGYCRAGSCDDPEVGCVEGYTCLARDGASVCEREGLGEGGAGGAGGTTSSTSLEGSAGSIGQTSGEGGAN